MPPPVAPHGPQSQAAIRHPVYWENLLVLVMTALIGIGGIFYAIFVAFSWWTIALAAFWLILCIVSITGGYHRLFAHRTYRAAKSVRLFYLLFGAASGQGSALRWSGDHRVHHARTDEDEDPYNIKRGFWWAHWGWLIYRTPPADQKIVRDLLADPLVRFQDRFYLPLAIAFGFLLPALIGWIWGDLLGALLLAGFFRIAVQYEATFCINSVAHSIGRKPYSADTSARDSHLAALLTMGEGYHNYHHRFPADYRNGVRFYQFDPTKWWIWLLSLAGLAWDLKRVPEDAIAKARESTTSQRMTNSPSSSQVFRSDS